ncbi:Putative pseudouridine transporter [Gemmata obscuriglobus]|uniref:Na+ dependent nucleoside transporter domain protein n=1 Tax=Gemmata obscuriglobus TaxID=114 RepID=A0A2Z3GRY5_9BACT|nr:nucleoside transporter C-terminal domain-containing protein [Gemmata obscuriglobus]AWM37139.1 Na+ dependent nucleoside transporter domain protein [Gemmata obscuriglobus]QEG30132.1 Putative pseudouridine transporter [Gemmata obscuriglobus]VTS09453.1 pyrimidine nucleoside transport protein : Na+ dependent nucleoside transporter domain protein OS=Solibacter usitatus (strain Ellin6076) GN=Acid_5232 PE=4 SV=1: Nucleos_tra2_N: Gate: Nucleos_tra2_C [Gemmata obscuriglobus UQM 2246]
MIAPAPTANADPDTPPAPPEIDLPPTPWSWRIALVVALCAVGALAYLGSSALTAQPQVAYRIQAGCGVVFFLGLTALFSKSLQSVSRKTLLWGLVLQFALAVLVLYSEHAQLLLRRVGDGIGALIDASDKGAEFVFGDLAKEKGKAGFVFAFRVLPPIIFVSSFFSVLYYLGVLQLFVRLMARVMMYLMGTSGAETLSVSANVFMGQTEAPLIVKPFVPRMTRSELLALMGSGMAHISGGMMAVYIGYGADKVAILCTCVMACPCSLYLTKLLYPEAGTPATAGAAPIAVETPYVNVIDAAAAGVKDGVVLAINVAAMLIAFTAFIALFDIVLGQFYPGLTLDRIFGTLFAPVAYLLGVPLEDCDKVGNLLGLKLAVNEHFAYLKFKEWNETGAVVLQGRSKMLAVYALTGFANFASVGIQLGGIGAMAPGRRADLAKLGMKALFIGFLATLLNAAVAGLLVDQR